MLRVTEYFPKSLKVILDKGVVFHCKTCSYLVPFPTFSVINIGVTLKFGFGVVQGHWK